MLSQVIQHGYSFAQVRARIAHTAAANYTRQQLIQRLALLGYREPVDDRTTNLSLGYKLAWRLLPASCPPASA